MIEENGRSRYFWYYTNWLKDEDGKDTYINYNMRSKYLQEKYGEDLYYKLRDDWNEILKRYFKNFEIEEPKDEIDE
ncbi:MAG: hypothetical protein MJZ34_07120 [Paludibacteraceae bacterium]|nr:hypothetical protein [Paludibacteraceae bacterium]